MTPAEDSPRAGAERLLEKLLRHEDLSEEEAGTIVELLMGGNLADAQAGGLLAALSSKGETVPELLVFARALRLRSTPFLRETTADALDLCGTGGAPRPTFNVSTVSAFVVAAAGVPVAKHGNVSARGTCGSSDLLEALGLPVRTSISFAEESFRRHHLAFLHAPLYHPATRGVAKLRQALGVRTIFNQLGPLTNPSGVRVQVVGAHSMEYAEHAVQVLLQLGCVRVLGVHGLGGTDEFSPQEPSEVVVGGKGGMERLRVEPPGYLFPEERIGSWAPLPPTEAAGETVRLLQGGMGSRRGAILLTSGAALWLSGKVGDLREGVEVARGAIDSGAAREKMLSLQALSAEGAWT